MDSNTLISGSAASKRKPKRLRCCLNSSCPWVVGGGKLPLRKTHIGEYARLTCWKCGALSVFNPIGTVQPHRSKDIFVARDTGRGVEHIFPKARVLTP